MANTSCKGGTQTLTVAGLGAATSDNAAQRRECSLPCVLQSASIADQKSHRTHKRALQRKRCIEANNDTQAGSAEEDIADSRGARRLVGDSSGSYWACIGIRFRLRSKSRTKSCTNTLPVTLHPVPSLLLLKPHSTIANVMRCFESIRYDMPTLSDF